MFKENKKYDNKNILLLKSPKKEQKRLRLFKGRKKIPEWAENLGKVEEEYWKTPLEEIKGFFRPHVV